MHASTNRGAVLALYGGDAPMTKRVQAVGGMAARDQRVGSWQQGLKRHDRLSAHDSVKINVRSQVGVTGGAVAGADSMGAVQPSGPVEIRPRYGRRRGKGRGAGITLRSGMAL
jgi:hypothetical protein